MENNFIFSVINQRVKKKFTGKPQVAHHCVRKYLYEI